MQLRDAQAADLDAIERLEHAAFDADQLSRRSLRYFLAAPTTDVPVVEANGQLVGYAMIGFRANSSLGRIFSLAVDPAWAGRGIGRTLLQGCEARARTRHSTGLRLEVRADNARAIRLYRSSGFEQFATLPDYYEDGAAAFRFSKPLPAPSEER